MKKQLFVAADSGSAIKKFWLVTKPTKDSELVDILFEATPSELVLQGRGGLDPSDVVGAWADKSEAEKIANVSWLRREAS